MKHRLFFPALKALSGIVLLSSVCTGAKAQEFAKHFADSTLRLDYIFAGDNRNQEIFLDKIGMTPRWAGRRVNLSSLLLRGNGQIMVSDPESGEVLYMHSFSSLFQEWQHTEEAVSVKKSFENCFLIPCPKHPVNVTVSLNDSHGKVTASLEHRVDPKDILIHHLDSSRTEYRYVGPSHGDPKDRIDVVIVAEGYTKDETDKFFSDSEQAVEAILSHEPFKSYKDRFNFAAVATPSEDSGVSIPGKNIWKNTATGSHFDTFYSARYLTTLNIKTLHNLLNGIPYEHIIILANTENYGGGGIFNSYTLTAAHHPAFLPVVVHEFGHSFGGLADEYYYDDQYETMYPSDTEPWEPNITTLADFASKWQDMLPEGAVIPDNSEYDGAETMRKIQAGDPDATSEKSDLYNKVGVYKGGGYQSEGVWRPALECRMKINAAPVFCPVCRRSLERLILFYTEEGRDE